MNSDSVTCRTISKSETLISVLEKRWIKIFEVIMANYFPNLVKTTNPHPPKT